MPKILKPRIKSFQTSVAGVTKEGRQRTIKKYCSIGNYVQLKPEPDNQYDENAIAVILQNGLDIGYLKAFVAKIRKKNSKRPEGSNLIAYIHDIGLTGERNNIYYVILNVVEYNNLVSHQDAYAFYEEQRNQSMKDIVVIVPKDWGKEAVVVLKKATELTFKGSVKLWTLSKKSFRFSLRAIATGWRNFCNSN